MEDQAMQLKDAGNKAFREGRWSDALMSYFDGEGAKRAGYPQRPSRGDYILGG